MKEGSAHVEVLALGHVYRSTRFLNFAVVVSVIVAVVVSVIVSVVMSVVVAVVVAVVVSVIVATFSTSFTMAGAFLAAMGVTALARVKNLDVDKVKDKRHAGDREHYSAFNVLRMEEALGGLVEEPNRQDPDGEDGAESTNNLDTMIAVGVLIVCVALGNLERADRDAEADDIGGDMGGIRHDGDRVCHVAAGDLNANEDARGAEYKGQLFHRGFIAFHSLFALLRKVRDLRHVMGNATHVLVGMNGGADVVLMKKALALSESTCRRALVGLPSLLCLTVVSHPYNEFYLKKRIIL